VIFAQKITSRLKRILAVKGNQTTKTARVEAARQKPESDQSDQGEKKE
jgi:hypothetical protein